MKFHLMALLPSRPGASADNHWYERVGRLAVDVNLGHHRKADAVVQLAELGNLALSPASCAPNWLQGKPNTTKPFLP